jgi:aldose sugar dehydrogenase
VRKKLSSRRAAKILAATYGLFGMLGLFECEGGVQMRKLANAVFLIALLSSAVYAQTNAGEQKPDPGLPFTMTQVASFDLPWRIAFLSDAACGDRKGWSRRSGHPAKRQDRSWGRPARYYQGQNGMLGIFLSPHYATDHDVYLTYVEPGDYRRGGPGARPGPACAERRPGHARRVHVLWRQLSRQSFSRLSSSRASKPSQGIPFGLEKRA